MLAAYSTTLLANLLFAPFLISVALHHQQSGIHETRVEAKSRLPKTESDWDVLSYYFHNDTALSINVCQSSQYEEYYESLPELRMEELRLPPNLKILFYGHSYLHELLQNILAANIDVLMKNGPLGGTEGVNLFVGSGQGKPFGYVTTWAFETNTTIFEIQNYEQLQRAQYADALRWFLEEQGPFDIAFFMNPHPDCYFDWKTFNRSKGGVHLEDYCDGIDDFSGPRQDVQPLWEVVTMAVGSNMFQVEAWDWQGQAEFHIDSDHVIRTVATVIDHSCNVDDNCSQTTLHGHQCQPGRLALVAEKMGAALRKAATTTIRWCAQGILAGDVCCDAECGTCGGSGCSSRPGGMECCTDKLAQYAKPCETSEDVACVIPAFFEGLTAPTPAQ